MDVDVLQEAGIADAVAAVVATDGDNSNVVIAQVIQKRWAPTCVVVRVQDPARAEFFAARGLRTVCPTQTATATMLDSVRACSTVPQGARLMYIVVAGGGKVGANVARTLLAGGARGHARSSRTAPGSSASSRSSGTTVHPRRRDRDPRARAAPASRARPTSSPP